MHKFTKNGSFVRAFDEKVRRFFESRLMRTCSRIAPPLPATLSAPLYHLNNELVYYRDQVLNILELQHAMITVRRNMNIVPMILFTEFVFLTQFDSPYMREARYRRSGAVVSRVVSVDRGDEEGHRKGSALADRGLPAVAFPPCAHAHGDVVEVQSRNLREKGAATTSYWVRLLQLPLSLYLN